MQIRNIVLMFHLETIIVSLYFQLNSNCANKNYNCVVSNAASAFSAYTKQQKKKQVPPFVTDALSDLTYRGRQKFTNYMIS